MLPSLGSRLKTPRDERKMKPVAGPQFFLGLVGHSLGLFLGPCPEVGAANQVDDQSAHVVVDSDVVPPLSPFHFLLLRETRVAAAADDSRRY